MADPTFGSVPVPDPTELTDKAIAKAVVLLTQYVDGKVELLALRDSMRDREIAMLLTERDEKIAASERLMLERHDGLTALVEERFVSAERQRLEQKSDTKAAVDAALTAQKEAVKEQTTASERAIAKSEAATTKQLEQQQLTVTTVTDALRGTIDEMKERSVEDVRVLRAAINDVQTIAVAPGERRIGAREDRSALYATIAAIGAALGIVGTVAALIATSGGG